MINYLHVISSVSIAPVRISKTTICAESNRVLQYGPKAVACHVYETSLFAIAGTRTVRYDSVKIDLDYFSFCSMYIHLPPHPLILTT